METKTIEQMEAEQKALQDKIAEVRRAEALKEREEKARVERIERSKKMQASAEAYGKVAEELVGLLKKEGIEASFKVADCTDPENLPNNSYPSIKAPVSVYFETAYSSSGWHSRANGVRIVIGSYEDRRFYKVRKDGTYNLPKIVETVKEKHVAAKVAAERANKKEALRNRNKSIATALKNKHFDREKKPWSYDGDFYYTHPVFSDVYPSEYGEGKVRLVASGSQYGFMGELTFEEADELLGFVNELKKKQDARIEAERKSKQ